jgi:predicted peroxiredoxin
VTRRVFVESRSTHESADVGVYLELISSLHARTSIASAGTDDTVTVFLVQNGVFLARRAVESAVSTLVGTPGVRVLVDDFSLRHRSCVLEELVPGIHIASMRELVALIARFDCVAVWH